ncbi:MAG: transglutaminase-like domain-containing protein [Raineya sp.]|nr:transglutaminase-like domain-containing protein [Raineya sp.]
MLSENEIKALITLLDDEDAEIVRHVEAKILSVGESILPFLETEWQNKSLQPLISERLEQIIHSLRFQTLKSKLKNWKEQENHDLLKGAWLIATYQYPECTYESLQEQIEQIYYNVWVHFRDNLHPYDQVKIINYVLFDEMKFSANTQNFHSPANSMLNRVLETRKGNPISLCILYILVAQKLNLPIYGVNMPNLFILIYQSPERPFYINAFNRGLIFTKSDIDNYIAQLGLSPHESFYNPTTPLEIIKRVCRNLIVSYEHLGETEKMQEMQELLEVLSD